MTHVAGTWWIREIEKPKLCRKKRFRVRLRGLPRGQLASNVPMFRFFFKWNHDSVVSFALILRMKSVSRFDNSLVEMPRPMASLFRQRPSPRLSSYSRISTCRKLNLSLSRTLSPGFRYKSVIKYIGELIGNPQDRVPAQLSDPRRIVYFWCRRPKILIISRKQDNELIFVKCLCKS